MKTCKTGRASCSLAKTWICNENFMKLERVWYEWNVNRLLKNWHYLCRVFYRALCRIKWYDIILASCQTYGWTLKNWCRRLFAFSEWIKKINSSASNDADSNTTISRNGKLYCSRTRYPSRMACLCIICI